MIRNPEIKPLEDSNDKYNSRLLKFCRVLTIQYDSSTGDKPVNVKTNLMKCEYIIIF